MNAGGHGSDIAASLVRYGWLDLLSDAGGEDGPARLEFSYRRSTVSFSEVVMWAELALHPGDANRGREELAEIVRWRRENQPGGSNAGSVFVNPAGDHAGRLVEEAGMKGLRIGSARVSEKHANFVQADPGGSADDVWRLIHHVRAAVKEGSGVNLETEVCMVGFSEVDAGDA